MAILHTAERLAARQPGGRLSPPLMAVLDEAANVVRIPELPDLYSHYGSRGIILSVYLQSWTQGAQAWGEEGIKKMWSAANVQLVGREIGRASCRERVEIAVSDGDLDRE